MMRKIIRVMFAILLLAVLLYAGDYVSARFGIPNHRDPFDSVQVEQLLVVPQKNGKPEFIQNSPQPETCVHSLFPQFGYEPCWYLSRHTRQEVKF